MKKTIILHNRQQARVALSGLWDELRGALQAETKLVLSVKPDTRSDAANRLLHATLTDISRQVEWAGGKRDVETWKRLMTAAWLRARGEHVEILPAVDGHGVDIVFQRTSTLTRAECSELQEFVFAWGVEHGCRFSAPDY